jgi:hypothetical protein
MRSTPKLCSSSIIYMIIMAIQVVEFSSVGTKLERFLQKNQHNQRKLLNFENWVNGKASKSAKTCLSELFSMSKIIRIFLNFFSLKNIQEHILFFDNITFLSKMMPNF